MKRIAPAWRIFVLVAVMAALAVGYMEYTRREALAAVADLNKQVTEASRQVNSLRERETKVSFQLEVLAELEGRLLDLENGAYYRQLLEALLRASRESGVRLDRLTFLTAQPVGPASAGQVSGSASGTEAQVLAFFRLLEEGAPLAQVDKLAWQLPTGSDSVPSRNPSGTVSFQIALFGPITQ